MTGGLAAALLPVVEKSGAVWVGSSGRVRDGSQKDSFAEIEALGAGALALLDLPAAHYGGYYEGFANSALWPALHSRSDLIRVSQDDYQSYREVNAFMARSLMRFRKPKTAFWIQDYHFLALGAELRERGVRDPIGFFLHTPWPARGIMGCVPHHRELIEAMLAYNLIGFQTDDDCENFLGYVQAELGLAVVVERRRLLVVGDGDDEQLVLQAEPDPHGARLRRRRVDEHRGGEPVRRGRLRGQQGRQARQHQQGRHGPAVDEAAQTDVTRHRTPLPGRRDARRRR